jgi:hypothetical protein
MQAHSGIGDRPRNTAHSSCPSLSLSLYFFFSLNMPPILQQSLAGLQREEVDLRADQDLRSLRCASEIISGIAVTSVHRKPQVFHSYHPFAGF